LQFKCISALLGISFNNRKKVREDTGDPSCANQFHPIA
jgi:hypothetical protein